MNLKYEIIAVIATLLLGVSIISSVVNYRIDIRATQQQLKDISLPLSIDNIYTEIQQRMIEPIIVSSLMANNTFVKDWVLDGEKDVKHITKYLKEVQDKYNMFTTFLVSDSTKKYYHPTGVIDTINIYNNENNWFFNLKKSKQSHEINLDIN